MFWPQLLADFFMYLIYFLSLHYFFYCQYRHCHYCWIQTKWKSVVYCTFPFHCLGNHGRSARQTGEDTEYPSSACLRENVSQALIPPCGINVTARQWISIPKAQRCQQIPPQTAEVSSSGHMAWSAPALSLLHSPWQAAAPACTRSSHPGILFISTVILRAICCLLCSGTCRSWLSCPDGAAISVLLHRAKPSRFFSSWFP